MKRVALPSARELLLVCRREPLALALAGAGGVAAIAGIAGAVVVNLPRPENRFFK